VLGGFTVVGTGSTVVVVEGGTVVVVVTGVVHDFDWLLPRSQAANSCC
jgi:hypothetical protein